jgi:hypothetical protein
VAASPEAARLDTASQAEMQLVAAGARTDMGNPGAAVVLLQSLANRTSRQAPWRARVYSAYADALETAGRSSEAREWLERAAAADLTGETGALERLTGSFDGDVIDLEEEPGDGHPDARD